MQCDSIVDEWLRSLGLIQYALAFSENGYDELELCKQIGNVDLDAIGVTSPLHRKIILDSVRTLLSEGATSVYFTLEEMNRSRSATGFATQEKALIPESRSMHGSALTSSSVKVQQTGQDRRVMNKLLMQMSEDQVDITQTPYVLSSGDVSVPVLTALAMRYADRLGERFYDVMHCMKRISELSLRQQQVAKSAETNTMSQMNSASSPTVGRTAKLCDTPRVRSRAPPALPSVPPPQHNSMTFGRQTPVPFIRSQSENANMVQQHVCYPMSQPVTLQHTCGRQNVGVHSHPISAGYSPSALQQQPIPRLPCGCPQGMCEKSAIYEKKRIDTLTLVRQGKISVNDAMTRIREYEKQRNSACDKKNKQKKSASTKIGEFFKLSSFRKKKSKSPQPVSNTGRRCSDAGIANNAMGASMCTLSEDMASRCTCQRTLTKVPPVTPYAPGNFQACTCDDCMTLRSGNPFERNNSTISPVVGHRSSGRGQLPARPTTKQSSKTNAGCDFVRAPPCCRQCSTPLTQRQHRPMFYSPQVTRKTYNPPATPQCRPAEPSHVRGRVQKNLPSDDESRNLIDSCQSDDNSSLFSNSQSISPFDHQQFSNNPPINSRDHQLFSSDPPINSRDHQQFSNNLPISNHEHGQLSNNLPINSHGHQLFSSDLPINSRDHQHFSNNPPISNHEHGQLSNNPPISSQNHPQLSSNPPTNAQMLDKRNEHHVRVDRKKNSRNPQAQLRSAFHTSDIGTSYHSDSLSSEESNTQQRQNNNIIEKSSGRIRRDSGCFLSNEHLNNNSSTTSSNASKHATDSPQPSLPAESHLVTEIAYQMNREGITLTEPQYTDQDGDWCVPISLVARYSQLLNCDLTSTALAMDEIRGATLQAIHRTYRPLTSGNSKKVEGTKKIACVQDFLYLCGLPMYREQFKAQGYDTLAQIPEMREEDIRKCGVDDPSHVTVLMNAISSTWRNRNTQRLSDRV